MGTAVDEKDDLVDKDGILGMSNLGSYFTLKEK